MSVDTLNADIATLRDSLDFMESVIRSGEAYTETVIAQGMDAATALARVEAELSRLTRALEVAEEDHNIAERHNLKRAEAAEARCARLQQALAWYADENNWTQPTSWGGRLYDDEAPASRDCGKVAREALAGPDTPADSHSTLLGREISGTDQCFPKSADSKEDTA